MREERPVGNAAVHHTDERVGLELRGEASVLVRAALEGEDGMAVVPRDPHAVAEGRADVDNLAKAALDALQDARVILDDRLVVRLLATKQAGDRPGVTVTVSIVEPGESIL